MFLSAYPPARLSAQSPDPIRVTLSLDRATCTAGDTLRATLVATNTSADSVSILWVSGQQYDFAVLTARGRDVWHWASDRRFDQALHPRDVAPGARLAWTERIPMPREPGTYLVAGTLTTQPARSARLRVTCRDGR